MATLVQSKQGPMSLETPIAFDSNVTAGNAIIVLCAYRGSDAYSVTDNQSNAYAEALGDRVHGNGTVKCAYSANVAGGATSVLIGADGFGGQAVLLEVSGLATSSIVDASAEGDVLDNTAPYEPGLSISTTEANTFLVVVASDADNDTRTCTGGAGDITTGVSMAAGKAYGYASLSSSGSKTAGLTFDGADTWAMQAFAFRGATLAAASMVHSNAAKIMGLINF